MVRLGALLPITGPGAWFGAEIRHGIELAMAELDPKPRTPAPGETPKPRGEGAAAAERPAGEPESRPTGAAVTASPRAEDRRASEPGPAPEAAAAPTTEERPGAPARPRGGPPPEPVEPADRPRAVQLALEVLDVDPLDDRQARAEFAKLLSAGTVAVFTASPTPTATVLPLAAARSVLVVHAGLPTERLAPDRLLLALRPTVGARAATLAAYAWERGTRRLALLTAGDEFGRTVRSSVAGEWRRRGAPLVFDESITLESGDLDAPLRRLVRTAPGAVLLGFQDTALGEAVRALRDAGYAGPLLAPDDHRAAVLAAGGDPGDLRLLGDAFVPEPGSRGERFARAYQAKHQRAPSRFAAAAYDGTVLLADAARQVLERGTALTGARLREALVAARRWPSLFGGEIVIGDDGSLARPLTLFRVEAGRALPEGYVTADGRLVPVPQAMAPVRFGLALGR
ncbi:MAG TPA: ABC transporter substrate-binding protein [Methylomirabilota bacterium]|nr:ABC transporter substrate-binding protein [Methylomirabilota bacterium]